MFNIRSKKGSTTVMFILVVFIFVVICSLVIDFGMVSIEKATLGTAVDAAVLAGAQKLYDYKVSKDNPDSTEIENDVLYEKVFITINEYLEKNGYDLEPFINIDETNWTISVHVEKNVEHSFLWFFNIRSVDVISEAVVRLGALDNIEGLRPFCLLEEKFKYLHNNQKHDFKGNYRFIDFNGYLLNYYNYNIYANEYVINDWINNGYGENIEIEKNYYYYSRQISLSELSNCDYVINTLKNYIDTNEEDIIYVPIIERQQHYHSPDTFTIESFVAIELSYNDIGDVEARIIDVLKQGNVHVEEDDYSVYAIDLTFNK